MTPGDIQIMLKNLVLKKPLAFIDVETTGLKPNSDRIVELSILKIQPDGNRTYNSKRINPQMPIPAEATAIHGITDADVAGKPIFRQYAKGIRDLLDGCDIAGFNVIKFDLPFLEAEFGRAGIEFSRKSRQVVDSQVLYHLKEPRDLNAAYLKYCGKKMLQNHTAEGDATAAAEILDGQLGLHADLPKDVEGLCKLCYAIREDYVDSEGKFTWFEGEAVCNFGKKHYGEKLKDIAIEAPEYLEWIMGADFSPEMKRIAKEALLGKFPEEL